MSTSQPTGGAPLTARPAPLGFLLDVDNTLLDNDGVKEWLATRLREALGEEGSALFWELYESVRRERDVVDLPLTAARYAERGGYNAAVVPGVLEGVPFADFLYPHALETLRRLDTLGAVAILTDGDQVFQRRKIERSGIAAAVEGNVLIYTHKQQHLTEVADFQPVDHSVIVDDKADILRDVKEAMGARVTTVHVTQGHYARAPLPDGFRPDITVQAIGDLLTMDARDFMRTDGSIDGEG